MLLPHSFFSDLPNVEVRIFKHMGSDFFHSVAFWGKWILTPFCQPTGVLSLAGGPGKGI